MKIKLTYLMLTLALLAAMVNVQSVHAANAVVGTGTPTSCTEAAFDSALTAAISGGTITFNCGGSVKTIQFTNSKIINLGNVTINGGGLIILAGQTGVRHFFINNGLTFTLQNITLRDGDSPVGGGAIESSGAHIILESVQLLNNYASNQGGAIYCYVGSNGTLTVKNSIFEHNTSTNGGAIYNDGCTTTISHTTFVTNQVTAGGGAVYNAFAANLEVNNSIFKTNSALDGGGFFNDTGSTATFNFVTFQANSGGYGGGLENSGTATLNNSLVDANIVTGSGGGIWNLNGIVNLVNTRVNNNRAYEGGGINSYGSHLQIDNASIINNVSTGAHGGGVFIGSGTAFITNATIDGNHAVGGSSNGGGIYHNSADNLTLTNVTLTNNQADSLGGGLYHYGRYAILTNTTIGNNIADVAGDAIYEASPMTIGNPGAIQLKNSVIFGSTNNCDGGIFDSLGYNISQGTCPALNQITDQNNFAGSLNLSILTFNGGAYPMQTMAPLAGSPLINAGDACPVTDQRGGARPFGGACDIGAVEFGALSAIFSDVPTNYWAWQYIERLYSAGITGGCSVSPLNYCPENSVTRDQMAIFLERGIQGSSFVPPNVIPTFNDTSGNFAEDWIEALKNDGITGGCGNGSYCPGQGVTRAQMAIFLERAMHGPSFVPPNVTPTFGDTAGNFAEDWIEALKNDAITSGCTNGNYCPDDIVTRAQMAVFLVKAFNLP